MNQAFQGGLKWIEERQVLFAAQSVSRGRSEGMEAEGFPVIAFRGKPG
jgi:hypothetical protein